MGKAQTFVAGGVSQLVFVIYMVCRSFDQVAETMMHCAMLRKQHEQRRQQ